MNKINLNSEFAVRVYDIHKYYKVNMNEEYERNLKIQWENDKKILLLDKELKTDNEIKLYIQLNRFNLPKEKE